jgi:hypothetical protein
MGNSMAAAAQSIQDSLIQMLSKKATEMAQLAD